MHPRGKGCKGFDQVLLQAYRCLLQKKPIERLQPRIIGYMGAAAVSIHTCVSENINSGCLRLVLLNPRIKGYKGLADQVRLGAYTCVLRCLSIQSCTQVRHGSKVTKVTKVWPTSCCCEHTHVRCRICQFRAATNIPRL